MKRFKLVSNFKDKILGFKGMTCLFLNTKTLKHLFHLYSYPENIIPNTEEVGTKSMVIGTNNVFEVGCCILLKNKLKD